LLPKKSDKSVIKARDLADQSDISMCMASQEGKDEAPEIDEQLKEYFKGSTILQMGSCTSKCFKDIPSHLHQYIKVRNKIT
jgi:hypothetical protein